MMTETQGPTLKQKVKLGLRHPHLIGRVFNQNIRPFLPWWDHHSHGVNFFDEDWDNLILLDACRYDTFEQYHDLPGTLTSRISNSSSTRDFLFNNFDGKDLRDVVYVTGNGQIANFYDKLDLNLHAVEPLYATEWDDEVGTVRPEPVTEAALTAHERYPNKRLVVHFVQPHMPFIRAATTADKNRDAEFSFWLRYIIGEVNLSVEELLNAYVDNLEYILPFVEKLLQNLGGKTVVTADHGNMFGERSRPIPIRDWGHPKQLYATSLVTVPWLEYVNGPRRSITKEDGPGFQPISDPATVSDRLAALGYR